MNCQKCGNKVKDGALFCPSCGQEIEGARKEGSADAVQSGSQPSGSSNDGNCPFCGSSASIVLSEKKKGVAGIVFAVLCVIMLASALIDIANSSFTINELLLPVLFGVLAAFFLPKRKNIQIRRCSNCAKDFEVEAKRGE